jgi:hypothetical protein
MLAWKRLSPIGIGPKRLSLETSMKLSSDWEKSEMDPSKRLLATESFKQLRRGDGLRDRPGELVEAEVELAESIE